MLEYSELLFIVGMVCMFIAGFYIILNKKHESNYIYYDTSPNITLFEQEECAICLTPLTNSKVYLQCKHAFHEDCVTKWLKHKKNCPICKKNL